MTVDLSDALEMARSVVDEARRLLALAGDNVGAVRTKGNPRDLVTEWDTRTEALIRRRFAELTPAIPMVGEETGVGGGEAGADHRWVVDPIDGTANFSHGLPLYSVSVALERFGEPVVGVVCAPALGWEFYASLGGGAFMNGRRLRVSRVAGLTQALLATGFPHDRASNAANNFRQWEYFQRHAGACRRLGSPSLDLCMVARGWFDGYWEARLAPWDLSAGSLMVSEAGGRVTGIDGSRLVTASGHVVASNGAIHQAILEHLANVGIDDYR